MAGALIPGASDKPPHRALSEIAALPAPVLASVCQALPAEARRRLLQALLTCEEQGEQLVGEAPGASATASTYEDLVQEAVYEHQAPGPSSQMPSFPPPAPDAEVYPPRRRTRRCKLPCSLGCGRSCGRRDKPWKHRPHRSHECKTCHRAASSSSGEGR